VDKKIDLFKFVIEVDSELIQKQVEPFKRPHHAYLIIAEQLNPGSSSILEHDPLFSAVNQIYGELYRPSDLWMPPMHVGAFMFRDVFFPLRIPIIYGQPMINPADFLVDVPDTQKRWLFDDQQISLTYFDQVIDLLDFVYGLDDLRKRRTLPAKTVEWWYLAKQQIEAAAATALGSFSKYAIVQNCCIATELLLKGALMAKGVDENTLKKKEYGHNLENLANKIADQVPGLDRATMILVVQKLPNYVKSRYEAENFSRLDLGNFLMNTQFISGEVLRQFSKRNFRADFSVEPGENLDLSNRAFPKK
jgi:hypothetical protein